LTLSLQDKAQYSGISEERDNPFLVISWNLTGLAQRRVDLPNTVTLLPAASPPYAHITMQNLLQLRVPRMDLHVSGKFLSFIALS